MRWNPRKGIVLAHWEIARKFRLKAAGRVAEGT